ncbi:MAG: DegT/DnrJ/EryC1/StrS family aminotransferase [Elusimicrobia bacterium]|nr:DegT/DnrJ/EryC1/StrS family aminotransferase [Elusimicrobiota bacterium]
MPPTQLKASGKGAQPVPFIDLSRDDRVLKNEIKTAALSVLKSCHYIRGRPCVEFSEKFASYCGAKYCVGLASGTDALFLALKAAGIGPGHEVITTPFTFFATAEAIANAGAKPVFADIDEDTWCISPAKIEKALTPKTKAIVPVHIFGQMADMDPIMKIAAAKKIAVIEDACQAHGAQYKGCGAGSIGLAGCFSFYPTKNLGACGDAGALVTNDKELAERVLRLADHGSKIKYIHDEIGVNSRLDSLQAAILLAKLPKLDEMNNKRRAAAALYKKLLSSINGLVLPREAQGSRHVYHLFSVRVEQRDRLKRYLDEAGIGAQIYYPVPLHLQEPFSSLGRQAGSFPVSEQLCREILSLPMFPEIKDREIRRAAKTIRDFFKN